MCGIVGVVSGRQASTIILQSLRRLEYRGYDSAGIATLVDGAIERRRAEGKLARLAAALVRSPLPGTTGIGHTRWATHGAPTECNAHPHGTSRVSIVHNGIIENHVELRAELEAAGQKFSTETDTETVAQLVDLLLQRGMHPLEAVAAAFRRLKGAYALAMIFAGYPEMIVGAQHGAPLAVGFGDDEMFVGSDGLALAPLTQRIAYLNDGDWAVIDRHGARFFDIEGGEVQREIKLTRLTGSAIGKGNFRHFMEKELHEHPVVIGDTLRRMIDPATRSVMLPRLPFDFAAIPRITISACGSAFYAGLVGRCWFEAISRIPTDADVASEFRYRMPPLPKGGLGILVSQSGETADTMAALSYLRDEGQHVLSIVNVPESRMARASDALLETVAGPEMSVASTKAFTVQLAVLACLAIAAGRARGTISAQEEAAMTASLLEVPSLAATILEMDGELRRLARRIARARDVPVPWAWQLLPDCVGRCVEAEGDQLHPRRGICGGRDETRSDRADRRTCSGHRDSPFRTAVREDSVKPAGGGRARRQGDRVQRCGRGSQAAWHCNRDNRHAADRSVRGAIIVCDPGPVAGVSCGSAEGDRCGSAAQPGQIGDRGMSDKGRRLFGTDGIRGRANSAPMTAGMALRLGQAIGLHFKRSKQGCRAVIGKDTRLSGYMLETALVAELTSAGMDVTLLGPVPTPAVAMLTRSLRADCGVMISASHNPFQDNGIKLFGPDGTKLSDDTELSIESSMDSPLAERLAEPARLGRAIRLDDAAGRYIEATKFSFPRGRRLDGLKVVVDCANGAAYRVAPTVLWELGADVIAVGVISRRAQYQSRLRLDCARLLVLAGDRTRRRLWYFAGW